MQLKEAIFVFLAGGVVFQNENAIFVFSVILLMAEILHQLIGSSSFYLQGFIHPRWCRISSISSNIFAFLLMLMFLSRSPSIKAVTGCYNKTIYLPSPVRRESHGVSII